MDIITGILFLHFNRSARSQLVMNQTIRIIIFGTNYLINTGLESLINENDRFVLAGKVSDPEELLRIIPAARAEVLLLDMSTIDVSPELVTSIKNADPYIQLLVFNTYQSRHFIAKVLTEEVTSYLMLCCDKEEITEAIIKTTQGVRFLCGHIVGELLANGKEEVSAGYSPFNCGGLTISERDLEIIRLIADGLSNQEIAQKLFLRVHTVSTHKRNIMNKLGLCNTASLVTYAVREKIVPSD